MMAKNTNKQTEKAIKAVQKKGKEITDAIIDVLEQQSAGVSVYDLYILFKHAVKSPGTIKSALERLEVENLIDSKEFKQDGRKVIRYFLKKQSVAPGYVEVNNDKINAKSWKNDAFVYLMDMETILVTPIQDSELKTKPFHKITIHHNKDKIQFWLPTEFIEFYQLNNRGIQVEADDKKITIKMGMKSRIVSKTDKKFKILLIEDEPNDEVIQRIIKKLEGNSHKVKLVDSIENFESAINKMNFDFLILDLTMESMNSKKFDKILNKFHHNNHKAKSIIITTAAYGKPEIKKYTKKGFSWFYDKDVPQIEEKIHTRMVTGY